MYIFKGMLTYGQQSQNLKKVLIMKLWNNRSFQMWLRLSLLAVALHFFLLGFFYHWKVPVLDGWMAGQDDQPGTYFYLPAYLQWSHWWDLITIPMCTVICMGIVRLALLHKAGKLGFFGEILVMIGMGFCGGLPQAIFLGLVRGLIIALCASIVFSFVPAIVRAIPLVASFGTRVHSKLGNFFLARHMPTLTQ